MFNPTNDQFCITTFDKSKTFTNQVLVVVSRPSNCSRGNPDRSEKWTVITMAGWIHRMNANTAGHEPFMLLTTLWSLSLGVLLSKLKLFDWSRDFKDCFFSKYSS